MSRPIRTGQCRSASVICLLAACLAFGCGGTEPNAGETSTPTKSLQAGVTSIDDAFAGDGEKIFAQTCAACHGINARGIPGLGKDLVLGDVSRRASDSTLVSIIVSGRAATDSMNTTGIAMPPKGGNASLTKSDVVSVVAYLRELQRANR